ncbi:MAG: fasciclin domain-containing protein [Prevotella sp.]|nr:fasciclin domain-containing protein [Candidatus Prevotella equi]
MKKIGNIFRLGGLGICCALLSLASCSEWDDHYQNSLTSGNGSQNTWELLTANPELSDFCEVLQNAKVFRQHKTTSVSYAELMQSGQSFTVLAPKNGTFNKDSLIALCATAKGDSVVEKKFIKNHISLTAVSNAAEVKEMRLANGKRIKIGADKVGNVAIAEANIPTRNGVMHIMETAVPYTPNIFEALCDDPRFNVIGEQLRKYNEDKFDEASSLSSGMVDGVKVYVDSVVYETNKLFDAIGVLNAEDSTYYVTVPTEAGWIKIWNEAKDHFYYDPTVEKADSMQHYWTLRGLLDDAIYSPSVETSPVDSLVNWKSYSRRYPGDGHVFYKPFSPTGIMGKGTKALECSNGTIYYSEDWTLSPEETYMRTLRAEGESFDALQVGFNKTDISVNKCMYNIRWITADSISGNGYVDIIPQSVSAPNWNFTLKIPNTIAGKTDIYAIVLPQSVYNPEKKGSGKSVKFKAYIDSFDKNGKAKPRFECYDVIQGSNKYFVNDPEKVDTILLAKDFDLESCNYDLTNQKLQIRFESNVKTTADKRKYIGEMFLDCILVRPSSNKE